MDTGEYMPTNKAVKPQTCSVLMLIENGSFPFDRRMRHLAEALREAGYKVNVICPKGEDRDRSSFEVFDGVQVYRYPMLFQASNKLGYILEYSWALLCLGALSLLVWIRDGVDIVHCANPPDLMFLIARLFKLFGKKFVYDQHDLCPELYHSKFERQGGVYRTLLFLERQSYRGADLVISTNQSYRDIARERGGITDKRSVIVRNGVDIGRFHRKIPRPELKRQFAYMAVYLGIMGKQDGVDRVVRAAHHIVHTFGRQDVLFVMIGKGECWHELQRLSEELKVAAVVQFVGHVPDDLLIDYLSTADVCLAPDPPDRMNQLSTMTKIMEYMACQRPIVSFDLLETRRSAGDAAVYVEKEDPKMFAGALLELLDDQARRERMGEIGLQRSIELVGLDRSRKALLEGYSRLLNKSLTTFELPEVDSQETKASEFVKLTGSGASEDIFGGRRSNSMNQTFVEYFRCPEHYVRLAVKDGLSENSGFFRFGRGVVGYGRCAGHRPADSPRDQLRDAWEDVDCASSSVCLPFELDEVVENLRLERYAKNRQFASSRNGVMARAYYAIRPFLPIPVRKHLQRAYLGDWSKISFPNWPVDHTVDSIVRGSMQLLLRSQQLDSIPFIWFWPDGASSAVSMTHDVETAAGRDFCESLMNLDDSFGIAASFQIVPEERYEVNQKFLDSICRRGFEVNVQDLNHDGRLYHDRSEFARRATKINDYGRRFGASGFRAAVLYRRQEWYSDLDFSYDMSVPNSGHLEPQRGGCCTVMPYFVGKILELPVTTTQDYSLFNYLRSFSIDLWKRQIDLLLKQNGLISFIVHPDYVRKDREIRIYKQLLAHLAWLRTQKNVWVAVPGEIDRWWRQRSQMELVCDGGGWRVKGVGSERARVAYASEKDGRLVFTMQHSPAGHRNIPALYPATPMTTVTTDQD
jgi:glycosyltransferase involved in cell wall biosynthesis